MKKILFFFSMVLFIFIISSCDKEESQTVKIMVPGGAPTLGFVKMKYDNEKILNYNIEYDLTSGPDLLSSAITSKSHQIVVAPSNMGAKLYSINKTYIYAGTLTFGNLYLVSTGELTIDNLSGKSICAFGKNSTPDIILRKILEDQDVNISYSNSGIDVSLLCKDLDAGIYFESDILQNYGLGSSASLCAALYDNYALHKSGSPETLRNIFSFMESYFHGKSSGMDPLPVYFNKEVALVNHKFRLNDSLSMQPQLKLFFHYLLQFHQRLLL